MKHKSLYALCITIITIISEEKVCHTLWFKMWIIYIILGEIIIEEKIKSNLVLEIYYLFWSILYMAMILVIKFIGANPTMLIEYTNFVLPSYPPSCPCSPWPPRVVKCPRSFFTQKVHLSLISKHILSLLQLGTLGTGTWTGREETLGNISE